MKSRFWRGAARAGLVATAAGVALTLVTSSAAFAALGTNGTATPTDPITLAPLTATEASTQQFGLSLTPTSGQPVAYCTASTSTNSTLEDSYFIPSTTDPSTLSFVGAAIQGVGNYSLYESTATKVVNIATATSGQIVAIPTDIEIGILPASIVIPGGASKTWNFGIVCAAPPAAGGASTVTDVWNNCLTATPNANDTKGYVWMVGCGTGSIVPESPLPIALPIGGAAVLGFGMVINRRRRRTNTGGLSAA